MISTDFLAGFYLVRCERCRHDDHLETLRWTISTQSCVYL